MEELQLVSKIKELKKIKPDQDWAFFTKKRILKESFGAAQTKEKLASFVSILEIVPKFIFRYNKFAFAVVVVFGFIAGAFTFAQNSLPGDPAFILKKVTERGLAIFASQEDLPKIQLELANKRLDELDKITKSNQIKKLAPAIQEFQTNISRAAADIIGSKNPNIKDIVLETKRIKENKGRIEALGVVVGGTEDLDNALLQLIQREIKDLEVRTLTQDQQTIFLEAVDEFNDGNFAAALEKIWLASQ